MLFKKSEFEKKWHDSAWAGSYTDGRRLDGDSGYPLAGLKITTFVIMLIIVTGTDFQCEYKIFLHQKDNKSYRLVTPGHVGEITLTARI